MPDYSREQPKQLDLPPRLPLVGLPNQRSSSTGEDSRLVNAYVEFGQDDVIRVVKRPGLSLKYNLDGYGAGLFKENSVFYTTGGGGVTATLYYNSTAVATLETYALTEPSGRFFSFATAPTGLDTEVLFLHNTFKCFQWDGSVVETLPFAEQAVGPLTCSITLGLTTATTASTADFSVYSSVAGTGITAGTYVQSIESATDFTLSAVATATNAAASLSFVTAGPPFRDLVSINAVKQLTDGVAVLNNSVYVFSIQSKVAGADADAPLAWQPLNYLLAYIERDSPVAFGRQLTHVIAFKSTSTEFFRDAGLSPGSSLERAEGLHLDVGCYAGKTVQSIDGILLWVSTTESGMRSVYSMERLRATEIASPAVKRALEGLSPTYAISFAVSGHSFYVLTDPSAGVSLVYDITSKLWYYWDALGETYFPFISATYIDGETRLQHESNGNIYVFDSTVFDDAGTPITLDIYPPQFDSNTQLIKYLPRMHVIADQEPGSILFVRNTDEDQKDGSWTNWRQFDLSSRRPTLTDCGSFTKRFFHFRHEARTPCRLIAVELELLLGVV